MPDPRDRREAAVDRPETEESTLLLGQTARGRPVYYDTERHVQVTGEPDVEGGSHPAEEYELEAETTVGDLVERVEEEVGWDSLTEFAQEHLPGVGAEDEGESEEESGGAEGS